jgi:hypothetical protein
MGQTDRDIIGYGMTKQEQEVIAAIRKIEYGEVTARIQAGKIVVIDERNTRKVRE